LETLSYSTDFRYHYLVTEDELHQSCWTNYPRDQDDPLD